MNAHENYFIPPHSTEAEQSVLGGLMLDGGNALDRIEGMLVADDFYAQGHQLIFSAVRSMASAGKPIDVITVAEALESSGQLERVGGLAYIGSITQNTPSSANIRRYAEIVKEKSLLRSLLNVSNEIQANCAAPGANVSEIVRQADAAMVRLLDAGSAEPTLLYDALTDAISDIDARATGHCPSGLLTGMADFDAITGGLEPGQLVVIAARPSVGKTAFSLNVADYMARQGKSIAFFSLEMTKRELTQRLLSLRAGVSVSVMRSGQLNECQWDRLSACQTKADGQQLHLIDHSAIGVAYVRATARKLKRKHGLDLIIVDYLGLMRGEGLNRTQEIGSLSRGLKALAKELSVPIVVLAQLNRATEMRQDKRPQLSDLRDSGEIEQDADIVVMLHREELYSNDPEWAGVAELIVRKNRNGPLGDVVLRYQCEYMRFDRYQGRPPVQHQAKNYRQSGLN